MGIEDAKPVSVDALSDDGEVVSMGIEGRKQGLDGLGRRGSAGVGLEGGLLSHVGG